MIQIELENDADANHRALRRCYSCGNYARPFDEVKGGIRCEKCAKKERRIRSEDDDGQDPSQVNFLV